MLVSGQGAECVGTTETVVTPENALISTRHVASGVVTGVIELGNPWEVFNVSLSLSSNSQQQWDESSY